MYTEQLTQRLGIINGVQPQSLNNSRQFTGGVDMSLFNRAIFIVNIGTVSGGSISCWLQESSDNFNTDVPSNDTASPFSNSSGTNVSSTGNVTSNSTITFEVNESQLTNGKRYVRLEVKEVNGSATIVNAQALGDECQHKPGNVNNGTFVATNGKQLVVS
jgi:hypothetical protein